MSFDLASMLSQLAGGNSATHAASSPDQFHRAAKNASPDIVSQGLSAMFKSDKPSAFSQMAGQRFGQADATQQGGMLNQMLGSMGPCVLNSLPGGAGAAGIGSILGKLTGGDAPSADLTPEQALKLRPAQMQDIAHHAEQNSPGTIEKMSNFYTQHPG
jgi:hypothetical protein